MPQWKGYVQLLRPPNLLTALADILGGVAVIYGLNADLMGAASSLEPWLLTHQWSILILGISSMCLYGGGVVLNDYFDAALDAIERPERPIPSGRVPAKHALLGGLFLLLGGVLMAFTVTNLSGYLALAIALLVVLYDAVTKKNGVLGPVNMGLCRGANLLMGMSLLGTIDTFHYGLAVIPLIYIAAITLISRGEVHGGNSTALSLGIGVYLLVVIMVGSLGTLNSFDVLEAAPFLLLFLVLVLPPAWVARQGKDPTSIKRAVKMGVLALIPLNAALAAGFSGWIFGLLLLILLPLSLLTARLFAVT